MLEVLLSGPVVFIPVGEVEEVENDADNDETENTSPPSHSLTSAQYV